MPPTSASAPTPPPEVRSTPPSEPALHLLHGRWVASCPACGYQLASSRSQKRCDRRGRRRTCPICSNPTVQAATP
jgi:hypothetical protein